jgi:HEAT repeat protein
MQYEFNPAIRMQGMETAAEVIGKSAKLQIKQGLQDESAGVRFAACVALGDLQDRSMLPAIRNMTRDPDPSVRVGAYYACEKLGDASYRRKWNATLQNNPDETVRRNAAMLLSRLEDEETKPLLQAVHVEDADEGVRRQAMEGLALLGDEEAIGRFRHDAYGGLGYRQVYAVLVLGRIDNRTVIDTLRSRLAEASYLETRLAAARGLGRQGFRDGYDLALESLTWNKPNESLRDDPPENQVMRVQSMAALALGEIGDPAALPALSDRMENAEDPRIQLAAARAILMIL